MTERGAFEDTDRLLRALEFRMAVTTAMLSTLDLDHVLFVILTGITHGEGLRFNRAFLFLDDDTGRELRLRMAVGPTDEAAAERTWAAIEGDALDLADVLEGYEGFQRDPSHEELARSLAGFSVSLDRIDEVAPHALIVGGETTLAAAVAACSRAPFCSNSLVVRHEGGALGPMEFRHVAVVPLSIGERQIGAIVADNLFSGANVEADDLRSLTAIGNLAALAIDRARLHARAVAMAEVDGLTGVYNRRHYESRVEAALVAATPARPLSIVVFDIDRFKRTNDTYGHLVGDELLKGVARVMRDQVRQGDVVARYGGEEFVLLLTATRREQAVAIAEKLRGIVAQARFGDGRVGGITLSAGVATSDGNESPEALFGRADEALYEAKAQGRDRVVAS